MAVLSERQVEPVAEPRADEADALRALVGAMLDEAEAEEGHLAQVASLCRARPEIGRQLLSLIDRYQQLGEMPAAQHLRIRDCVEQSLADAGASSTVSDATATMRVPVAAPLSRGLPRQPPGPTVTAPLPEPPASRDATRAKVAPPAGPTRAVPRRPAAPQPAEGTQSAPPSAPKPSARETGAEKSVPTLRPAAAGTVNAAGAAEETVRPAARPLVAESVKPLARAVAVETPARAARPGGSTPPPAARPAAAEAARAPARPPAAEKATTHRPAGPQKVPPPAVPAVQTVMPSAATVAVEESMPSIAQILQGLSAADAAVIGPGTVLRGRFELQGLLGYGGMASVFKAVDRYRARLGLQDCCVALKIIAPHPPNPDHVAALGREFHNAQQLSHPNIINVYEIDHEGDASFYTMELLEGEQLNQLQERVGGLLPQRYALAIIRDIGEAIAHAHSRGVVHADLKPQNIFVTYGGQVRVLDFGGLSLSPATPDFGPRATLSASLGPPTGLATPFGPQTPWIADLAPELPPQSYRTATPAYASCEQLEGQRADPRDDVYALGCIAYELLAGRHPFEGKSATQARAEHLRPRRPPGLRTPSWRALRSALSWRRSQRPRHIGSWLEQLGIAAAAERLPPSHQLQAIQPPRLWLQRLAAATLLVAAAGAAAWAVQHNGPLDWQKTLHSAATTLQNAQQELRAGLGSSRRAAPASSAAPAVARAAPIIQAPVPALAPADPGGPSPGHSRPADADASTPAPGHTATAQPRHSRSSRGHARGARGSSPVAGAAAPVKAESPPNQDATVDAGNPGAGVTFATSSYAVADGAPAARLLIRRTGSFKGDLRFAWWTEEDSAKADVDYAPLGRRIEHIPPGADSVAIFVPIISNPLRHRSETFYVALGRPGEVDSEVPSARATVTIDRGG